MAYDENSFLQGVATGMALKGVNVTGAAVPVNLSITTPPTKTVYHIAESFDKTGMVVQLAYSNGATRTVDNSALSFYPLTFTSAGGFTVTLTWSEGAYTLTCTQAVTVVSYYIYGYDLTNSDSNPLTRVSYPSGVDNASFTAASMNLTTGVLNAGGWNTTPGSEFMPKPCMLKFDGTVDYYLDPDDYTKKTDGTASDVADSSYGGNAMMEWPKIFAKRWEENGVYHFRCSDAKVDDDYECWSNYDKNNNQIEHFYTPIYFGSKDSSNRLRSISGGTNSVSTTAQNEVTYAKANGADIWYTEVVSDYFLICDLLVLMFKSTDLQAAAGYGNCNTSAAIAQGTMNDKGLFYGLSDKSSGVKVFGMENWWGNIWRRIGGWLLVYNEHKVKLTRGTKDGTTASDYNFDGTGYLATGVTISSSGYISGMTAEDYGRLPSAVGGSSSTYEADFFYQVTVTGYAYVGGDWGIGLIDGPFNAALDYDPSATYTSIGAALSCKPLAAASAA